MGRGPWLSMTGQGGTQGHVHVHAGVGIDKIVFLTLEDGDALEAAMLLAFGPPATALPHLLVDVARVGRDYGVFVDLVPRVDLAIHAQYLHRIYAPFTDVLDGFARHAGLRMSPVPCSLRPFVSPWMAGFRCKAPVVHQLFELLAPYVSTWLALHGHELPPVRLESADLTGRDMLLRAGLFSSAADPVWDVLGTVVGPFQARRVLDLLRTHGVPPPPPPES